MHNQPALTLSEPKDAKEQIPNVLRIIEHLNGYYISQCLMVAAELGIADILRDGPVSVERISLQTEVNQDSLHRMLSALCKVGVFEEGQTGQFSNNELSAVLTSDGKYSVRSLAMLHRSHYWHLWSRFYDTVKFGGSAALLDSSGPFEKLAEDPRKLELFHQSIGNLTKLDTEHLPRAYDFSHANSFIDIGGGNGQLAVELVRQVPHLTGAVFDLEEVNPAFEQTKARGPESQVKFVSGNFFQDMTLHAYDLIILKNILHDWEDRKAHLILRNCRNSMTRRSQQLLIVEVVLNAVDEPLYGRLRDLNMMVSMHTGRERSLPEFQELLMEVGLRLIKTSRLPSGQSLMVCCREEA
jgi:hypothetical protein